jgi:hypothetical protein
VSQTAARNFTPGVVDTGQRSKGSNMTALLEAKLLYDKKQKIQVQRKKLIQKNTSVKNLGTLLAVQYVSPQNVQKTTDLVW